MDSLYGLFWDSLRSHVSWADHSELEAILNCALAGNPAAEYILASALVAEHPEIAHLLFCSSAEKGYAPAERWTLSSRSLAME
jgi:hypothetical protein